MYKVSDKLVVVNSDRSFSVEYEPASQLDKIRRDAFYEVVEKIKQGGLDIDKKDEYIPYITSKKYNLDIIGGVEPITRMEHDMCIDFASVFQSICGKNGSCKFTIYFNRYSKEKYSTQLKWGIFPKSEKSEIESFVSRGPNNDVDEKFYKEFLMSSLYNVLKINGKVK